MAHAQLNTISISKLWMKNRQQKFIYDAQISHRNKRFENSNANEVISRDTEHMAILESKENGEKERAPNALHLKRSHNLRGVTCNLIVDICSLFDRFVRKSFCVLGYFVVEAIARHLVILFSFFVSNSNIFCIRTVSELVLFVILNSRFLIEEVFSIWKLDWWNEKLHIHVLANEWKSSKKYCPAAVVCILIIIDCHENRYWSNRITHSSTAKQWRHSHNCPSARSTRKQNSFWRRGHSMTVHPCEFGIPIATGEVVD